MIKDFQFIKAKKNLILETYYYKVILYELCNLKVLLTNSI